VANPVGGGAGCCVGDRSAKGGSLASPTDSRTLAVMTHTLTFRSLHEALDALTLLVERGYKQLHGSLEKLVPKSARLVAGKAFGLRRGHFVVVWKD